MRIFGRAKDPSSERTCRRWRCGGRRRPSSPGRRPPFSALQRAWFSAYTEIIVSEATAGKREGCANGKRCPAHREAVFRVCRGGNRSYGIAKNHRSASQLDRSDGCRVGSSDRFLFDDDRRLGRFDSASAVRSTDSKSDGRTSPRSLSVPTTAPMCSFCRRASRTRDFDVPAFTCFRSSRIIRKSRFGNFL